MLAYLVFLLLRCRVLDRQVVLEQMHHSFVEAVEIREEIVGVIHQSPLATCVFVAPSVPLAREIDPFRMAELITHEGEVTAVDG